VTDDDQATRIPGFELPVYPVATDGSPQPCGMEGCTRDADYFTPLTLAGVVGTINVASCIEHLRDMAESVAVARDRRMGD
jgi:hypothetical protein